VSILTFREPPDASLGGRYGWFQGAAHVSRTSIGETWRSGNSGREVLS
jgi:hypothetical protein